MDSQGGNLYHRCGTKPFPGMQKCVKIFELDTHFVRLRIGKEIRGSRYGFGSPTGSAAPGKFRSDR